MQTRINPKEAASIISALEAGVVPQRGVRHLLVGRNEEVKEVLRILDDVAAGGSDLRFWVGDFGSGKSFMLRTIEAIALQKNYLVATVDMTPTRRFYATDGKAKALYTAIVNSIISQTAQNGNALDTVFSQWINQIAQAVASEAKISLPEALSKEAQSLMTNKILDITGSFAAAGLAFEMGQAIVKYYEGVLDNDRMLKAQALRWIRGEIETKTEAKRELGINRVITDDNWFDAIKNLSELFSRLGYAGLVINFDEAVNLYKLPRRQSRERNYERILNIYNECKSNEVQHLLVNFGATRKTVFDETRGLASYGALKGRLGAESSLDSELVNTNKTVLPLKPLTNEEIYTLLQRLTEIYNLHYRAQVELSLQEVQLYMEEQLNRPGADQFLTPRAVIKDYIEILDLIRQNPAIEVEKVILSKFGQESPVQKDSADTEDDIEVF
ncbi:biotin carboxylase [Ligilactobacillus salitolerans]|uniref:Biotin carboxylase n=1 Tax=Ligilactobacillus salitolerans TaxID=1808352 RepID=A0A401ISL4_9LACO|nr:ATP-binding protein [Ligilactobacillus salitolerans]GBG94530.1 biotin carboxylase [Ligilactobacillus salitolerans]